METLIHVSYISHNPRKLCTFLNLVNMNEYVTNTENSLLCKDVLLTLCEKLNSSTAMNNWHFMNARQILINDLYKELKISNHLAVQEFFDYVSTLIPSDAAHVHSIQLYNLSNGTELLK